MNTNISTNSWHYKLALKNLRFRWNHSHRRDEPDPIDTCSYVTYVLIELSKIFFKVAGTVVATASVLFFLSLCASIYFDYTPIVTFGKSSILGFALYFIGALITLGTVITAAYVLLVAAILKVINIVKNRKSDTEKPAGFFTLAKMKFKEKTCTRVVFIED